MVLQFHLKNGQKTKKDDTFLSKKLEEKQNSATIMIFADGKGTVFPVKINMTSDHSVSSNNSFKSLLDGKSFSMFLML